LRTVRERLPVRLRTHANEHLALPDVHRDIGAKPDLGQETKPRSPREDPLDVAIFERLN
jgi:hypothetical protein